MLRLLILASVLCFWPATVFGQLLSAPQSKYPVFGSIIPDELGATAINTNPPPTIELVGHRYFLDQESYPNEMDGTPGMSGAPGGGSGGEAGGAADAVNPSAPLAQIQFLNVFIPNTRGADGYANTFIIQPVIPINLSSEFFPFHIVRPTLPLIEPANPDGPLDLTGGVGDLTIADVFVHPIEEGAVGAGYVMIAPTSTDRSVGLGEWQLGPAAVAVTTAVPDWVLGSIVLVPMSLESEAYEVQMQLIATRLLENQWYVGWGDSAMKFDDQDGRYSIPLQVQIGKVVMLGQQPINVYLQGEYIPRGFQSGGGEEWGIKVGIIPLLPGLKIGPFFGHHCP